MLAVVERFWINPFYSLTLYDIATPISDRVMPTYRVMPPLYLILAPLLYDAMPTYRVIPPLYLILVPLLYDVMPTDRVTPPLCRILVPLLSSGQSSAILWIETSKTSCVLLAQMHRFRARLKTLKILYRLLHQHFVAHRLLFAFFKP